MLQFKEDFDFDSIEDSDLREFLRDIDTEAEQPAIVWYSYAVLLCQVGAVEGLPEDYVAKDKQQMYSLVGLMFVRYQQDNGLVTTVKTPEDYCIFHAVALTDELTRVREELANLKQKLDDANDLW